MVTLEGSLLVSDSVTPPGGAGAGSETDSPVDWPRPTEILDGRLMVPRSITVILAVVSGNAGGALAGMVAAAGLLELKLTTRPPAGAGEERVSVKFCLAFLPRVRLGGEKPRVAATWTGFVSELKPGAVPV